MQPFQLRKKCEVLCKRVFLNAKPGSISVMDPLKYAKRFSKFMKQEVFKDYDNEISNRKNQYLFIDEQTRNLIEMFKRNYTVSELQPGLFDTGRPLALSSNHTVYIKQ